MNAHAPLARNIDQPIAGLLRDLKQRGMLDDTLVVWTTEFGRTPFKEAPGQAAREHQHWVFSSWMAGGGVKAGTVYMANPTTLAFAWPATRFMCMASMPRFCICWASTNEQLTFRHSGRDCRLTDVAGHVVQGVLA